MAMHHRLGGVYTAIVTPFTSDGEIDGPAFARLLAFQLSARVTGVVVSGTTGEAASLSVAERKRLFDLAAEHRGPLQVIAGTGSCSLAEATHLFRHAHRLGLDAALVIPPFFYRKVSSEGTATFLRRVLDSAELPALIYHIPQLSGIRINSKVITPLLTAPNFAGIKDSSEDAESVVRLRACLSDMPLFVGAERLASHALEHGAAGIISGAANVAPRLVCEMWNAHEANRNLTPAQQRLNEALNVLEQFPSPAGLKAILESRGLPGGSVRLPLLDLSRAQRKLVASLATEAAIA